MIAMALAIAAAAPTLRSTPSLGVAEGRCRPNESGPAIVATVVGLKDRRGRLRAELYPADDHDFLADDNVLVAAGKVFRRAVIDIPAAGDPKLCLRVPGPGTYALAVVHARDGGGGFKLLRDGIGFAGNPALHMRKPTAAEAAIVTHSGLTTVRIVMNYRRGLFSFGPLR